MKTLAILTLAAAALFAASGAATAQYYGPGPGVGIYVGPRYDDRPRYRERYYRQNNRAYYRGGYRGRSANGCPRGYTVQDGVCKPYRGY
jgi:hypothetical protein